jgi:hypothetical protein
MAERLINLMVRSGAVDHEIPETHGAERPDCVHRGIDVHEGRE